MDQKNQSQIAFKGNNQKYEQEKKLGQGKFGHSYLVKGSIDNKYYCLKKFEQNDYRQREKEFIEQRLKNLPQLKPLLKVYEIFEKKNDVYQILEYCNEGDLRYFMKNYKLSNYDIFQVIKQIAQQLEIIHSLDFIYLDLKPENIVVKQKYSKQGPYFVYKLCDFGSLIKHQQQSGAEQLNKKTETKLITPEYEAPEIFNPNESQKLDKKADIWSLGVILCELFEGKKLFSNDISETQFQIQQLIGSYQQNQESIFKKIDQIPQQNQNIKDFIKKMIDPLPQNRLTITEIIENAEKFMQIKDMANIQVIPLDHCKEQKIDSINISIVENFSPEQKEIEQQKQAILKLNELKLKYEQTILEQNKVNQNKDIQINQLKIECNNLKGELSNISQRQQFEQTMIQEAYISQIEGVPHNQRIVMKRKEIIEELKIFQKENNFDFENIIFSLELEKLKSNLEKQLSNMTSKYQQQRLISNNILVCVVLQIHLIIFKLQNIKVLIIQIKQYYFIKQTIFLGLSVIQSFYINRIKLIKSLLFDIMNIFCPNFCIKFLIINLKKYLIIRCFNRLHIYYILAASASNRLIFFCLENEK